MTTSPSFRPRQLPLSAEVEARNSIAGSLGGSATSVSAVLVGCVSALALLMIHTYLAPMHLEEQRYIGVLFLVASVLLGCVAVCLVIPAAQLLAWWSGAALCVGMALGYVASRTVGLPNGYQESWRDTWGTTCLVLEAVYLLALALWSRGHGAYGRMDQSRRQQGRVSSPK